MEINYDYEYCGIGQTKNADWAAGCRATEGKQTGLLSWESRLGCLAIGDDGGFCLATRTTKGCIYDPLIAASTKKNSKLGCRAKESRLTGLQDEGKQTGLLG